MMTSTDKAAIQAQFDELGKGLESAYTMAAHSEVLLGVLVNELKESGVLSEERSRAMFQRAAALAQSASEQLELPADTRRVMAQVYQMLAGKPLKGDDHE